MNKVKDQLNKLPKPLLKKIKEIYGDIDKFYATVYLIARNAHQCEMKAVPGWEQRLKTIRAYQGMIRFMLDEAEVNGREIMDDIATEYLEDFIKYKEQDFGMTDDEFISIIKKIG